MSKKKKRPKYDPTAFAEDFDDLPDGAFFALAAEMGIEPEDFVRAASSSSAETPEPETK